MSLCGCTQAIYGTTPLTRTIEVDLPPHQAAQRSAMVLYHQFQARLEWQDRETHTLQVLLKNTIRLTVTTTPAPHGAAIHLSGSVLPNRLAIGAFTEVDDVAQAIERDALLFALTHKGPS